MTKSMFKIILNSVFVFMLGTMFVSCKNNAHDEEGINEKSPSKRIKTITMIDGDATEVNEYSYDAQGRPKRVTSTYFYSSAPNGSTHTTEYTYYGDVKIISKTTGQTYSNHEFIYTISNGLIVNVEYDERRPYSFYHTFSYDENGYINSATGEDEIMNFKWTDGNLTQYQYNGQYPSSTTWEYSNELRPKNWIGYWKGTNMDENLQMLGLWGKMPIYLPSKQIRNSKEVFIEYEKENGDIVKVIYNDPSDPIPIPEIYLIDWELVPTTE